MDVIPLTLTVSLCLVFTFLVFFLREHSRARFRSAESEAILPFAEETARVVTARASAAHHDHDGDEHVHAADDACGCRSGVRPPCAGCLRGAGRV